MPALGIHPPSEPPTKAELGVIHHPSPNFGPRKNDLKPSIVVIHYTAMQDCDAAIRRLCDPESEVSAHYIIDRDGAITQMVAESMRAWHAGQGEWRGLDDINSRSIGIELDNTGAHPFAHPQMEALTELLHDIKGRWDILPENIIGHSDMAPGRKKDPGAKFDWARLARQGLAGPTVARPICNDFPQAAHLAGFTASTDPDTLLQATRLRFAPWRTGPLCDADLALFHRT